MLVYQLQKPPVACKKYIKCLEGIKQTCRLTSSLCLNEDMYVTKDMKCIPCARKCKHDTAYNNSGDKNKVKI